MVQAIGLMVAAYILTRMIEVLHIKESSDVIVAAAVVTILVTLWGAYMLLTLGMDISNLLPGNQVSSVISQ